MKKMMFSLCLVSLAYTQATRCGEFPGIAFTIPNPYTIQATTAFDKLTVGSISRGLTFAASIALFYHASDNFALSFKWGSKKHVHQVHQTEAELLAAQAGRRKVALAYFLTGCAFTAAGLIQQYGSEIVPWIRNLCHR